MLSKVLQRPVLFALERQVFSGKADGFRLLLSLRILLSGSGGPLKSIAREATSPAALAHLPAESQEMLSKGVKFD